MNLSKPICPHCRSLNVLPFEEGSEPENNPHFLIILVSAFLIIGFYFLFVILSYMSYPIMVIVVISVFSIYQKWKDGRKKQPKKMLDKEFLCIDCGQSFKYQVEMTQSGKIDSGGSLS
jgi:hypothetical protein